MKTIETYIVEDVYRGDREFDPITIEYSNVWEKISKLFDHFLYSINYDHTSIPISADNLITSSVITKDDKFYIAFGAVETEPRSLYNPETETFYRIEGKECTMECNGRTETWPIPEDRLYYIRISKSLQD